MHWSPEKKIDLLNYSDFPAFDMFLNSIFKNNNC